jgi:hypothetical protein
MRKKNNIEDISLKTNNALGEKRAYTIFIISSLTLNLSNTFISLVIRWFLGNFNLTHDFINWI